MQVVKLTTFSISFAAGFEFFQSANGVILCPGDQNGILPASLFAKVVHKNKKNGMSLLYYLSDIKLAHSV